MRCDECRYFFPIEDKGACRRKPPVLLNTVQTGFPTVLPDWWCGEFKPKPTVQYEHGETAQAYTAQAYKAWPIEG